jgi:hypothetical protein
VTDSADFFVYRDAIDRLTIGGIRRDARDLPLDAVRMEIRGFQGPGTYAFGSGPTANTASLTIWFYDSDLPTTAFFPATAPNAGTVTVSAIDTVQHLVYGVFSFNGVDEAGTRVAVAQGRFRVSYSEFP